MALELSQQIELAVEEADAGIVGRDEKLSVLIVMLVQTLDAANHAAVDRRDVRVAALDVVDSWVLSLVDCLAVAHAKVVSDDERLTVVEEVDAGRLVSQVDVLDHSIDDDVVDAHRVVEGRDCELSRCARVEGDVAHDIRGRYRLEYLVVELRQAVEHRLVLFIVILHNPYSNQVLFLDWIGCCNEK